MFHFSARQILLLAAGFGLIAGSIFFDPLLARWEQFLYPNAVYWQGVRVVPGKSQHIRTAGEELLVVRDDRFPMARLTLFVQQDEGVTPQKLVRDLCVRDGCSKNAVSSLSGDTAVANYRNKGESMQIALMRMPGDSVWVEFRGPPEAFAGFEALIQSVSAQLEKALGNAKTSRLARGQAHADARAFCGTRRT
jgi:hypothetical protein